MKQSRLGPSSIPILAAFAVLTSFGVVATQTIRRDRLARELAASEREMASLEKRYKELRPASTRDTSATPEKRHMHDHHDGDGD